MPLSLYALYSLPSVSLSLLFSVLYPISYGVSLYGGGLYGYGDPIWGGIWGMTLLA